MWLKKIFVMVLVIASSINCFSVLASANDLDVRIDEEIIEEYQIADKLSSVLGISGHKATYSSNGSGNCTSITVEHTLQKHWGLWIWEDVAGSTYSRTVNRNNIYLSSTKSNLDSGTYRVKSTFTLTNSAGQTETITIYSLEESI